MEAAIHSRVIPAHCGGAQALRAGLYDESEMRSNNTHNHFGSALPANPRARAAPETFADWAATLPAWVRDACLAYVR